MPLIYIIQWVFQVSILKTSGARPVFCATFCGTLSPRSCRTLDHKKITELLLVAGKPVIIFCISLTNLCLSSVLNSSKVTQEAEGGSPNWQLVLGHLFWIKRLQYLTP